jgi:hypothetical protein
MLFGFKKNPLSVSDEFFTQINIEIGPTENGLALPFFSLAFTSWTIA